jgi:hypothetical protein
MSDQDAFERILAALYDAMLDDAYWPTTSALIDEACGLQGNALIVSGGPTDDVRVLFAQAYYRGRSRQDWVHQYLTRYHPIDERVPRIRRLADKRLVHITDLYSAQELQTSPTYNEAMRQFNGQNGLTGPSLTRSPRTAGKLHSWRCSAGCCPICANLSASEKPWPALGCWVRLVLSVTEFR